MSDAEHITRVSTDGDQHAIVCDICGRVGQPQDYKADAEAIAERHHEIGGCER